MIARFLAGIATFLALIAIITAFVEENRNERQARDLASLHGEVRDEQTIIEALVRTQGAQGDVNTAVYKSLRLIQRTLGGHSRSLASSR